MHSVFLLGSPAWQVTEGVPRGEEHGTWPGQMSPERRHWRAGLGGPGPLVCWLTGACPAPQEGGGSPCHSWNLGAEGTPIVTEGVGTELGGAPAHPELPGVLGVKCVRGRGGCSSLPWPWGPRVLLPAP